MKSFISLLSLFALLSASASSDEENTPAAHRKNILSSQFICVGRLQITDYAFLDSRHMVVKDDGKRIEKAYVEDRFENRAIMPQTVSKWAKIEVSSTLKGDADTVRPFLKLHWQEPSLVICPHHATALGGKPRIWVMVAPKSSLSPPYFVSLPVRHLDEVKKLLSGAAE